jgi:hypothetical protein
MAMTRQRDDSLIKMDLGCLGVIAAFFAIGGIGAFIRMLAVHHPVVLIIAGAVAGVIIVPLAAIWITDRVSARRARRELERARRELPDTRNAGL